MKERKVIRNMKGLKEDDERCCHSPEELISLIEQVGFLPLFRNPIKGFSVEEYTAEDNWWTRDERKDPWLWRIQIAKINRVAYGKFFKNKAGFISKKWFPYFANFRRGGYDFNSLYEDGGAKHKSKRIMNLFEDKKTKSSIVIKNNIGFGKEGVKNFNGTMTELQMQMYLTIQDFKKKINKNGQEYGMYVRYYNTPEQLWGYKYVTSCYQESPETSRQKVEQFMQELYPMSSLEAIRKYL